jgi:hypothetical protein
MLRAFADLLAVPALVRAGATAATGRTQRVTHLHRYIRADDDPFSSASLYACRCGVVRPGM